MMENPDLLKNYYYNKEYETVVACFTDKLRQNGVSSYDYCLYMNSLYKLSKFRECLSCYKEFHKMYPASDLLNDIMGWSVYRVFFKNCPAEEANLADLVRKADFAITKSGYTQCSPRWKLIKSITDRILDKKEKSDSDYLRVKKYLEMADPETLSSERADAETGNGKRKIPSDKDGWYSRMTKVLLALKQYEACIDYCDRAVDAGTLFQNNNDIWNLLRKVKCLIALNRMKEAGEALKVALDYGVHNWNLYYLLFEIEEKDGEKEQALQYGAACGLESADHEKKVGFFEKFATFLEENDYLEESMLHRRLVLLLRQENNWRLQARHQGWNFTEKIKLMNKQQVLQELKSFWSGIRNRNKVVCHGTIRKILTEGKSGFIQSDDGAAYYFNARDIKNAKEKNLQGKRVTFTTAKRLDKKKNVIKPIAVEIEIV